MPKDLNVRWRGDVTQLQASAKQAEAAIEGVNSKVTGSAGIFQRGFGDAGRAVSGLSPLFGRLGGDVAGLRGEFGNVLPALGSLSEGLGGVSMAATAGVTGVLAVGGALATFASKGVKDFVDLSTSTRQLQLETGESATSMSGWIAIARAQGVSVEALQTGFARLAPNIADNEAKLAAHGLQVARNADGTVNLSATLQNLTDLFHNSADRTDADAAAKTALGRSYAQLLPLLGATREQQDALIKQAGGAGMILTDAQTEEVHRFSIEMAQAKQEITGAGVQLGEKLVPMLGDLATGLGQAVHDIDGFINSNHALFTIIGQTANALAGPLGGLLSWGHNLNGAKEASGQFADTTAATDSALAGLDGTLDKSDSLVDKLRTSLLAARDANNALTQAQAQQTSAEETLAEKRKALADLQAKAVVDEKAVAQATLDHERATQQLSDAQENLSTVQARWNEIQTNSGQYGRDHEAATLAVQRASEGLTDAQRNLTAVQDRLNDVQARAGQYARDLADAESQASHAALGQQEAAVRLAEARKALASGSPDGDPLQFRQSVLALREAQLGVTDAAHQRSAADEAVTKLQNEAIAGTKEYEADQVDLRNAHDQVASAAQQQSAAQATLTALVNEAVPGTAEYAAKQRELRDASNQVADARSAESIAQQKLTAAEAGDPQRADNIAKARKAVADAENSVRTAREAIVTDSLKVQDAADKEAAAFGTYGSSVSALNTWLETVANNSGPAAKQAILDLIASEPAAGGAQMSALTQQRAGEHQELVVAPRATAPATAHPADWQMALAQQDMPAPNVHVEVHGSVIAAHDLATTVRDALNSAQRHGLN